MTSAAARPMRKWPIVAAFWAAQTALVFLFFPLLEVLTGGGWQSIYGYFRDGDYLIFASIYAAAITVLQAAFVAPIYRPQARSDPRPGFWRLLACGMGLGVTGAMLLAFAVTGLNMLNLVDADVFSTEFIACIPAAAIVLGTIATIILRRRFRSGIPVKVSLVFAIMLAGLLVVGIFAVLFDAAELLREYAGSGSASLPDWAWISLWIGVPIASWIVFTPLILAFARRGHPDRQLSRLANRLFIGTVIEAIVTIPIDAMVRRKTSCYCGEGTFWALIICGSVGLITMGPAIYLLPIGRRRQRLLDGRCPACGYDMSGSPKADRCPECGAGWKAQPDVPQASARGNAPGA